MQSNVTTVEVSKCVCAAVELPRKSGLHCVAELLRSMSHYKQICRKPPIVQSPVRTVLIF
ncbi:hypothetical protein IQ26_06820 [Mesorhizobium tianshanense]|uniref:Uncharacterized protein n=1 Tax=Mesorhizobium tianshanense TaxID=39844 RepID=A0A562MNX2_9HYPH|nr:hypothetical protein IQ26_06820 [Mesorhizobium tianshanense]